MEISWFHLGKGNDVSEIKVLGKPEQLIKHVAQDERVIRAVLENIQAKGYEVMGADGRIINQHGISLPRYYSKDTEQLIKELTEEATSS